MTLVVYLALGFVVALTTVLLMERSMRKEFVNVSADWSDYLMLGFMAIVCTMIWPLVLLIAALGCLIKLLSERLFPNFKKGGK